MNDVFGFVSLIVLGCGIYTLYAYIKMKKTGEINEIILLGNAYVAKKCKNKKAFLEKALPSVLVFGIVTTIYGVIDMINSFVKPVGIVDTIANILFLIVLVGFLVYTTKLKKQYF